MYSIGQVAEMFGLPISTLRYYDKQGLFPNSVCGRRKRRGRDRRSYCAGASLSDGQGCLNKHFRYEEHILSQQE